MKKVLCLAVLIASAALADEAVDRASIEAALAALNTSPYSANLFTADFANAGELQRFLQETSPVAMGFPTGGVAIRTQAGTLVISREPMGEATFYTVPAGRDARFAARSITFVSPETAVVVAVYERPFRAFAASAVPVLFVLKREAADWRFASFRALPEAR